MPPDNWYIRCVALDEDLKRLYIEVEALGGPWAPKNCTECNGLKFHREGCHINAA